MCRARTDRARRRNQPPPPLADGRFSNRSYNLAAVRAVIIRASLRPREFDVDCPVQRRCRTIDRGGILGGVMECLMGRLFLLPWACATDIADRESEAEVIAAMAALRMFNIFNSPLEAIVAPGRDRAAMSIFSGFGS